MRTIVVLILAFLLSLPGGLIFAQQAEIRQESANVDSLLESYSVDEILKYKDFYEGQINKIESEKKSLREKGIRDALNFLETNPNSKVLDKVYIRLAELYYQKDNNDYLEAMQAYDQKLDELDKAGVTDTTLIEPQKNYDKSIALYQKLIDDFPHSVLLDDAIYNRAFLLEELNRKEEAVESYNKLVQEFTSSRYVSEALMRIAEYYFNPPINDIEKAIEVYKQILEYKDSPKYDEALYRLGWSYYRLNNYPEAVAYFTLLADDVQKSEELDPDQKYSNPALRDESIEYIGISFLDFGGAEKAAEYIKSIGGREYGREIITKIGDIYKDEKEEYVNAINTYNLILKLYPDDPVAPATQGKIVECYRRMKDDMMAYLARDKLYNYYNPSSAWWQKNLDQKVRDEAYTIAESALRDNIALLFQKAGAANDKDLYLQAVTDNQKYLKSFPDDSSAVQIHWNMALTLDTKLNYYDRAFEEYLKISDLYWNSKYQKDAANNAIALAKDAVSKDTTKKDMSFDIDDPNLDVSKKLLNPVSYKKIELSKSERNLARAYDNYIKLFPHEPETATILSNAGALYYNNNQFTEALKYFNTLAKHFPEDQEVNYAKYMVLEGYFGKRDFKSAEIIARRLKNTTDVDPDIINKAKKRLAESIFLSAEVYADSANHLAAGNEYLRMVNEVPDAEFADLSLFNAALEYDKAKEFSRAVESYSYLLEIKPNSKYKLDAMNNLAFDYGELKEYKNAGLTYENLFNTAQDSAMSYEALYNSSIFFVKGKEWEDAIRINRKFVNTYPKSQDSDNLFFDIATYYLKLDKLIDANKIYGEYVQRYPSSPRVIETYFQRGEYYRDNNEIELAISEYNMAVIKNNEFRQRNIETNNYFAAEALFQMTKLKYDKYCAIEFYLPKSQMDQSKKEKKELLKEVIEGFTNVVSYSTLRLYEATYYIGDAYEELAETWVRQEIPPMEENKRIVYQKQINQTTADLFGRAENSYKHSVEVLSKLADKYKEQLLAADTTKLEDVRIKIVNEDSTLRVARKWTDRCKEKISEVIYDIAELNTESVKLFLNAPIPVGLDDVAEMEYYKQILGKAVAPLIKEIVAAHLRNIKEAWEIGLENQWVKLSRNKVITASNILSNEYQKLGLKSIALYQTSSTNYEKLTLQESATSDDVEAIEISEQMANLLDFGKIFATVAIELRKNTILKAESENISDPTLSETREVLIKDAIEFTLKCDSLAIKANKNRKKYETLFKEQDKVEFEDALFTYEDNLFFLKESMGEILEKVYDISEEINITGRWVTKVKLALTRLNPEQYSNLLNLSVEPKSITTDATWLASSKYIQNWTKQDYDDSGWKPAHIINDKYDNRNRMAQIWDVVVGVGDTLSVVNNESATDSTIADSAKLSKSLITKRPEITKTLSNRVFFRKAFYIEGLPVSAELNLKIDDSYNIFLNGEYMTNFTADSTEWQNERSHMFTDFLLPGKNVLAIEAKDSDLTGGGLVASMQIKSIPEWDNLKQKLELETSSEKVKQNLVMDKYIILF